MRKVAAVESRSAVIASVVALSLLPLTIATAAAVVLLR